MIGIQIVNNSLYVIYHLALISTIAVFAINDIRCRIIPNKWLVFALPIFLLSPILLSYATETNIVLTLLNSVLGAILAFSTLLFASTISRKGAGIGGGDIKLLGLLGFSYGAYDIILILLIATFLCSLVGILKTKKEDSFSLPFIPFVLIGSFFVI